MPAQGTQTKPAETKAQRVERLKSEKNPWECLDEIREFARRGFDSIPAEWLGTYFRWWGVYTQGDGAGAMGGKGGEGKATPYFMVRVRVPNGMLRARQLRAIATAARDHARGVADLTVRQNVQLHWITIESLPEVLETLWGAGLTTMGSCGDDTRNITGCPLAGLDRDEFCDASPLGLEATSLLVGNPEFYNLPRKFKICITGCRVWCSYPEINDVGLTALTRTLNGHPEVGFSLRVGGGLSAEPLFGQRLDAFVQWNQVIPVVRGVAEIFRDADVLRDTRERARLKYLFMRHGWTAQTFKSELERRIGFRLDRAVDETPPADVYRDHVGIRPQKQDGYCYVGVAVLRGRITPEQMQTAADLADRFGSGELRTTNMQNLLIVNVPERSADALAAELERVGLPTGGSPFWRGAVACTGTEFCKLAITETKSFSRWLVEELEDRLPGFDQHLKLHVTGCPNSCGQHWIADLGIEGKKVKVDGQLVDAYYFCVGGAVGEHQGFARPVGYRCPAAEVPEAIERLLRVYEAERYVGENLRRFFARHSDDQLRNFLAGAEVVGVARDPSPGRPPHGVEG
jgi:sulfite reductase (ferredoxin)